MSDNLARMETCVELLKDMRELSVKYRILAPRDRKVHDDKDLVPCTWLLAAAAPYKPNLEPIIDL